MKKLCLFCLFCCLLLVTSLALASDSSLTSYPKQETLSSKQEQTITLPNQVIIRPKVGVIYINDAQTTYNKRIDKFILENLHSSIPDTDYQYVDGLTFVDKLIDAGVQDLATAERADIIEILAEEKLDYLVYLEIEPIYTKSKATVFSKGKSAIVTAPFKIIDMRNNKTLYNGKITEQGKTTVMMGKIGNKSVSLEGIKLVNLQVKEILAQRLPK